MGGAGRGGGVEGGFYWARLWLQTLLCLTAPWSKKHGRPPNMKRKKASCGPSGSGRNPEQNTNSLTGHLWGFSVLFPCLKRKEESTYVAQKGLTRNRLSLMKIVREIRSPVKRDGSHRSLPQTVDRKSRSWAWPCFQKRSKFVPIWGHSNVTSPQTDPSSPKWSMRAPGGLEAGT